MDNNKIKQMLAAANGANHVGEYPSGSYSPMPNRVGSVHAVADLQEILALRAQVEQLQAKIFELHCFDVDVIRCLKTMAFDHNHVDIPRYQQLAKNCMDEISAGNRANEIKAQAVEALKFPTMLRKMWSGGEVQAWIKEEAKLIRPQANGGN